MVGDYPEGSCAEASGWMMKECRLGREGGQRAICMHGFVEVSGIYERGTGNRVWEVRGN